MQLKFHATYFAFAFLAAFPLASGFRLPNVLRAAHKHHRCLQWQLWQAVVNFYKAETKIFIPAYSKRSRAATGNDATTLYCNSSFTAILSLLSASTVWQLCATMAMQQSLRQRKGLLVASYVHCCQVLCISPATFNLLLRSFIIFYIVVYFVLATQSFYLQACTRSNGILILLSITVCRNLVGWVIVLFTGKSFVQLLQLYSDKVTVKPVADWSFWQSRTS